MAHRGVRMRRGLYGICRDTSLTYDEAVRRTTEQLKKEGFGVLTEIDVRETLRR